MCVPDGPGYGIYRCLVNRMDYLERLIDKLNARGSNEAIEAEEDLLRWQDRYQFLTIYMELAGRYDDASLKNLGRRGMSPLEFFAPRDELTFGLDELPDLIPHAFFCKYWGAMNVSVVPFESNVDLKILELFTKAQPKPCAAREIASIICAGWEDGVPGGRKLFDCVCRIFLGGLLGVYDHCRDKAGFRRRRQLYHWFSFSDLTRESMVAWISKNKMAVTYLIREMAFFSASCCSPLEDFMNERYYWASMKRNAYSATNKLRVMLNDATLSREGPAIDSDCCLFSGEGPIFPSRPADASWLLADSVLIGFNKKNLRYSPRRMDSSFYDKMKNVFTEVDIERASELRLANLPPDDESEYAEAAVEVKEIVEKAWESGLVESLRSRGSEFTYYFLFPLGVSLCGSIAPLKHAERLFRNDTDKGKLKKVAQDIRKSSPRDYALLRAFFIASQREDAVRIYDLPDHFKERQEDALRRIYNLDGVDDVALPPGAGTFFVCLNCSKIKAPIIRAGSAVNPRRSRTNSPSGVSYDMLARVMYCSKLNNKKAKTSGSKKQPPEALSKQDAPSLAQADSKKLVTKEVREAMKKEQRDACPHTEVRAVNLVGKLIRTGENGLVLMCPSCSRATTLTRSGFISAGGAFSCGCDRVKKPTRLDETKCIVCKADKVRKEPIRYYRLVYDDISTGLAYMMPFCELHKCDWIELWNKYIVLPLSVVRTSFYQKWTSILVDAETGERRFLDGTERKFTWKGKKM